MNIHSLGKSQNPSCFPINKPYTCAVGNTLKMECDLLPNDYNIHLQQTGCGRGMLLQSGLIANIKLHFYIHRMQLDLFEIGAHCNEDTLCSSLISSGFLVLGIYSSLTNFVKVFFNEISNMPGHTVVKLYICTMQSNCEVLV